MSLKEFYSDPYYQIRSFSLNAAIAFAACAVVYSWHDARFYNWNFSPYHLLLLPLGIYIGGMSCVFIHNATHQSFPNKFLNDLCGYLAGFHQLWGYRGWKLIHLIHHQYSDTEGQDPHPTKGRAFWPYLRNMFVKSSLTISRRYAEHWQNRPQTALLQKLGLAAFISMVAGFIALWFVILGPVAFLLFYVPSLIWNHYMFAHINYYCHPLNEKTRETEATNLTNNLYYKLANKLWCGIYYHGNHHKKPTLFNPKYMINSKQIKNSEITETKNAA